MESEPLSGAMIGTEQWLSCAYHMYMPRYLPSEEESLATDTFTKLFLEFLTALEEKSQASLKYLSASLQYWMQSSSGEIFLRQILSSNEQFLLPLFLPNHNSLLCVDQKDGDTSVLY